MPTHAEKIEAAMVAYLSAQAFPDTLENDDEEKRIFAGESEEVKDGQCILCIMDDMQEEFPERSGNRYSLCRVELRTSVEARPENAATTALEDHIAAAEILESALLDNDLAALLTAAIADFTAFGILDRQPIQEQNENYWMNGYTFRLYSCPKAFS